MVPDLGQEMYKMSLRYYTVPKSKEAFKDEWILIKNTEAGLKDATGQRWGKCKRQKEQ